MSAPFDDIAAEFAFPIGRMRATIAAFQDEMRRGLAGGPSSLKMLPTYADNPTGRERGSVLALDLGGTNVRVLLAGLTGDGRAPTLDGDKFKLEPAHIVSDAEVLFGAIARFIGRFLERRGLAGPFNMGFTFSFPIRQLGIDRGELIVWTKGWSAAGVVDHDVVALLNRALAREGLERVRVVSLNNDTTGTQVARAYFDPACDAGCILGTGTNVCYRERTAAVGKPLDAYAGEAMIINMESGNFNRELPRNRFDAALDEASENPGEQWTEKMVSGKYLGELVRLVVADLAAAGRLYGGRPPALFAEPGFFTSEHVCAAKADVSAGADAVRSLLAGLGASGTGAGEAVAVRRVGWLVSARAARIAAAVLAAAISKGDPALDRPHTAAVDGSVFEKHPGFKEEMEKTFLELWPERGARIRPALTHDGSGLGAAIIAASTAR